MVKYSDKLRFCDGIRYRVVMEEGLVVNQPAREVLSVNEVGAVILKQLDGRRTVEQIARGLQDEFNASLHDLERDTQTFLEEMVTLGICRITS